MHLRLFALGGLALAAVIASACSSTNDASSGSSSSGASSGATGGASAQQVDACKEGCNKMKFFGCNSAEEQATCYDQCTKATPAQIELFTACAQTSICDPACRTNITPKPAPGQPAKGTGATASSCATACDKLVSCSYVKVGEKAACVSACEKEAYQYQIDCVNNNACDKLPSACGGTGGGSSSGGTSSGGTSGGTGDPSALSIADCQSSCDQLLFFDCFSAAEQATCRASCTKATGTKRDAFSSCAKSAGGECSKANACYSTFKG